MIKINLLPWREELREERKQLFFLMLGAAAFAAVLVMASVHIVIAKKISNQTFRNSLLNSEIKTLNSRIKKIRKLEAVKSALLARMSVIEKLQSDRALAGRLFKSITMILPEGVHLVRAKRMGDAVLIKGYAESNTNISNLMREIEKSKYLRRASLNVIRNERELKQDEDKKKDTPEGYAFEMHFILVNPDLIGAI